MTSLGRPRPCSSRKWVSKKCRKRTGSLWNWSIRCGELTGGRPGGLLHRALHAELFDEAAQVTPKRYRAPRPQLVLEVLRHVLKEVDLLPGDEGHGELC